MKDTHGAARTVVTRSPARKVGIINCKWFQSCEIQHESQLEKRFVHRTFLCTDVERIQHQPFTIHLDSAKYTPDFLVFFSMVTRSSRKSRSPQRSINTVRNSYKPQRHSPKKSWGFMSLQSTRSTKMIILK